MTDEKGGVARVKGSVLSVISLYTFFEDKKLGLVISVSDRT